MKATIEIVEGQYPLAKVVCAGDVLARGHIAVMIKDCEYFRYTIENAQQVLHWLATNNKLVDK